MIATLKMNPRLVGAASINYKIKHVSEKMSEEGRIALNNIYDINENVKGNKIT